MNLYPLHWYLCFERRHAHAPHFFKGTRTSSSALSSRSSSNVDVCFKETEKCKNFDRLLFVIHCDTSKSYEVCARAAPWSCWMWSLLPWAISWRRAEEPGFVDTWKNQADIVGIHFGSAEWFGARTPANISLFMFIHVYSTRSDRLV